MEECRGGGAAGNSHAMVVAHSLFVDDAYDAIAYFWLVPFHVGADVVCVSAGVLD